ncbi:hypothetical protein D6T64_18225 [Cryobacterium melibiosiphilum]|uniref:SGNH/GDSL hydrolase family protein n=1 Tax=Cryobacterium melibiosiphilum TaxID=995039 RepID=A0A3A5MC68_9MICO|nr:hypothetical protein [Cryobacterium melibiosiphilum]RJT86203.1 hypothetical protein D6T64_18225 [Cryobacterium melibiosiphilum]
MKPWTRRGRRHQTCAEWFDANVKFMCLGLTAIAVFTVAVYALNSGEPQGTANLAGSSSTVDGPDADTLQVAVIGDFFTECAETDACTDGNATGALATELGWNLHFFTELGSGYIGDDTATSTFGDRVDAVVASAPQIVIVQGGRYDREALDALPAAAADVLTRLHEGLPDSDIVVIGPASPSATIGPSTANIASGGASTAAALARAAESAEILSAAAEASGAALFIDPVAEGWFVGVDPAIISSDSVYATAAGHAYLVDKLLPLLAPLRS